MITKPLVAGLLAVGCLGAAAGGAYVAVQSAPEPVTAGAGPGTPVPPLADSAAVAETEAIVAPEEMPPAPATPLPAAQPVPAREPALERAVRRPGPSADASRAPVKPARSADGVERPEPRPAAQPQPARVAIADSTPAAAGAEPVLPALPAPEPPRGEPTTPYDPAPLPAPPIPVPEFVQVMVPASSVIGLQVETSLSSERTQVEDRVEARVTRDVLADERVAIPAGSRVVGSVILVERGGKIKERARLGVRFHTLVFADGTELPIRTDPIYRDGESPSGESAKKIGGAAVGGAILGAILGGGKGAMIGGAAGAAGGTAATMAGDRNAATLPSGTVVTVRLTQPLTVDVEKPVR